MPGLEHTPGPAKVTVRSAITELTRQLAAAGIEEAGRDARRLVAAALAATAEDVLRTPERELGPGEAKLLESYLGRRRVREPVSRIVGEREFFGRTFAVSPATLDPRPDTETVVAAALEVIRDEGWASRPLRILDVGTGSGCLLLTLLCELPQATGLGTDIGEAALAVAQRNASRLGVEERAAWQVADALETVGEPFHILVANPPYVRTEDISGLEPEVRNFDPMSALDGGTDGLVIYRRLMERIPATVPAGWVLLEVGHDQADAVADLLVSEIPTVNAKGIRVWRDVAGIRRCVAARTRG
jgi:release factor glutamine methyltransferase